MHSLVLRSLVVCAVMTAAACSDRDPPRPCETASDCGAGYSCLRELPTLSPAAAEAQLKRVPLELCIANKKSPVMTGFVNDGRLFVGAAKVDVTPRGFETHNNINDPVRCPKNKAWLFDGYIDAPRGQADPIGDPNNPCLETFNDTNGNGYFDAIWMGGFDQGRAATGVDEEVPIMARMMVMAQGTEHYAIVVLDLVGILPSQQEELRQIIHTEVGIDRNRILIHVTHDHESPDTQGIWGPTVTTSGNNVARAIVEIAGGDLGTFAQVPIRPGVGPDYWPGLEGKVVGALKQALGNMRAAKMRFVQTQAPQRSRPFRADNGQTYNVDDIVWAGEVKLPDYNNNGIINDDDDISTYIGGGAGRVLGTDIKMPHIMDHTVSVVQVVDATTNQTISTLVNWNVHVESLSDENTLLSADYAGFLCNYVEKVVGGVALYTIGPIGGLQMPLRGVFVPKMDPDGNFIGPTGQIVASIDLAVGTESGTREKAKGIGRVIGRTAVEAIMGAPFVASPSLKVKTRFAWIPLDNPYFYIGARLGILPGLIELFTGKKRSDTVVLGSKVAACGGAGCVRTDVVLADFGPLRIISAPGELYPEYLIGRAASSFKYGSERMKKYEDLNNNGINDAEEAPIMVPAGTLDKDTGVDLRHNVLYRYPLNPQKFTAIPGLRPEDKQRNGTQALIVLAESNNALGYLIPESDHINRYEGFLSGVGDYLSILGAADLRFMLDLKVPEEIIFRDFVKDVETRFIDVLAEVPGVPRPDGGTTRRDIASHMNQQGDENSTGRRSGNIVYNTMCELLHNGACPTPLAVDPDPHATLPRAP